MPEKISSAHDDLYVPKATEHLGEYSNYPERFDPKEKSVLSRLGQFGITEEDIRGAINKDVSELSWEEYTKVIAEAIRTHYDTVVASVFDQYMFPTPENPDEEERVKKMLKLIERFKDMEVRCGINLVKHKDGFNESANVVLGLEAGAHLINSVGDARRMADEGIKLFGLQYGKDSTLADSNGLTGLGRQVVMDLLDHNLIIDLAHAGYNTRQEVIDVAKEREKGSQVSYTHGSTEDDILEGWREKIGERALKKEEVEQIIKMGGLIGLGITKPFFGSTKKLAERIYDICQLDGGIDRVAIGSDFGGVPPAFTNEIKNPEDFQKLADLLSADFRLPPDDINKILRSNVKDWIKNAID